MANITGMNLSNFKISSVSFVKGIRGTDDILHDGKPQIAFVGRSNVGKSSIINALLDRKDLVKTGKKPGKTTEINFFLVNKEFYLVDLPGYGYAKVPPKDREKIRKMIIWYLSASEARPATVALIVDAKVGVMPFDRDMIAVLRGEGHRVVVIANKIDKLSATEREAQLATIQNAVGDIEVVPYSATVRKGTDELRKILLQ